MTREAAIRILGQYNANFCWEDGETIPAAEIAATMEMAIEAIKAIPVRCKDCSYYLPEWPDDMSDIKECRRGLGYVRPDDYCSKGRRRLNAYG